MKYPDKFQAAVLKKAYVTDKSRLYSLIIDAEMFNPDDFTAESYGPLKTALDYAKKVYENDATFDEVLKAYSDLYNAITNLKVK